MRVVASFLLASMAAGSLARADDTTAAPLAPPPPFRFDEPERDGTPNPTSEPVRPVRFTDPREEEPSAEEESSVGLALLAGGATALVPFAVGALVVTSSDDKVGKRVGVDIGQFGFAAAPLVAHLIVKEPGRGVLFSLVPLASATALAIHQIPYPVIVEQGSKEGRIPFAILYTLTTASAAVGLIDAAFADRRKKNRLVVGPHQTGIGLSIGGAF